LPIEVEVCAMDDQPVGAKFVRVLRGGQITLPIEFRRALGIGEGMMMSAVIKEDGSVLLRPMEMLRKSSRGSGWLSELKAVFEPVRREFEEKGYTEEEINQWIDEAVAGYRKERRALQDEGTRDGSVSPAARRTA